MQRRTAVAAASAISISLVSAVVALGANFGALGFAAPASPPSARPAAVAMQSPTPSYSIPAASGNATGEDRGERRDQRARPSATDAPPPHGQDYTMTDPTNDRDRAERIRRLQERRATPAPAKPTARSTNSAQVSAASISASLPNRPRQRHPAAATRWLLAGLSVGSFLAIGGTVAAANRANLAVAQPASSVSSTGTTAVANSTGQPTAATPATPRAATNATTPAPHTTTRGS